MSEKQKPLISLEKVARLLHVDKLGEHVEFTPKNGFYEVTFREPRNYQLKDGKIGKNLSLRDSDGSVTYGYFKSRASFNSRFKLTKRHGNHYGEYLASIILKQLDIPACRVDIGVYPFRHPYKQGAIIPVEGSLSHYQLKQADIFIPLSVIAQRYKSSNKKHYNALIGETYKPGASSSTAHYTNIEIILASIQSFLASENQESKINKVRQQIFDMCLFDLKFANRDRHDDNFGLKVNQDTGEINFYELFDNEQILGMQLQETLAQDALDNPKRFEDLKRRDFTSYIGYPGKPTATVPTELFSYLLQKYPKETIKAYKKVSRYSLEDLKKTMEVCLPDMPDAHRNLACKLFEDREREMAQVLEDYYRATGPIDENTLDEC